ncbi:MAG: 3-oxoacyl-[acyl-carrier-protein] reductase [Verrucomicrobia bacterium]|nr:3-oxoacyl-[acyl-carrier-protein] reductase [Verrucomicrobiota bacterium]
MTLDLTGKVAVITGAGRGIGRAVALAFARAGADVACVSRTETNAKQIAEEVGVLGRKSQAYAVDVAKAAEVDAAAEKILADFGRVDVLVNNAGINRDGLLMRMSETDWEAVLTTNLGGAFHFTRALSRGMIRQRAGRIINITSIIGLIGNAGQANYAASKAGLIGFTKSVAREFASRGITCNAIAPGFIETDMTSAINTDLRQKLLEKIPLGRFGQPDDVARCALFLASPAADYITGQVLTVDGGMVM